MWQRVARDEAIPKAGDHVVSNIGDRSVIVMRGEDGQVHGFADSCLHCGIALRIWGRVFSGERCSWCRLCGYHCRKGCQILFCHAR